MPPDGSGLPLAMSGHVRPWTYGASHSELRLRTVPGALRPVELFFVDVRAVHLASSYADPTLDLADVQESARMLEFAGLTQRAEGDALVLRPSGERAPGYIVCGGFTAWRVGPDGARREVVARAGSLVRPRRGKGR
ncbi:hypothetical protein ABZ249_07855 [Nocardiopsis sp. NPDC006139]|uniref:hypothetical protein n=1 Tax=Nocardiopsis sp. NPDC006139 TaxID=3154578 RepID=UPI0033A5B887